METRLPPQDIEMEKAVLGAILLESKAIELISLEVEDFYSPKNQIIYRAILSLQRERNPIDAVTVVSQLRKTGDMQDLSLAVYISELTDGMGSSAHIEYHSLILKQKSIARKLIVQSQQTIERAYDEGSDIQETIEFLDKSFTEITTNSTSADYSDMKQAIEKTTNYLANIQNKKESGVSVNIPTGLIDLNEQFNGGWSAPDLVILGGKPSMGKTTLALHFAQTAASQGKNCLFASIEMTTEQLIMRILTQDERLSFYNMRTGQMSQEEWQFVDEKVSQIIDDKLFIADGHDIRNLNELKSLARKMSRNGLLDLLVIDYLQLMKTNMKFGTRDLEIGYITGELKNLAKELDIPIILLAQLSRSLKGSEMKEPILSDLRESGNIEQDADKVIFPHRPTYYSSDAIDDNGNSWENRGMLIIAKNREGQKDAKVLFRHDANFKKIMDDRPLTDPFNYSESRNEEAFNSETVNPF